MKIQMKLLCLPAMFVAVLVSSPTWAQKDGSPSSKETPYCDVLIAEMKETMQKEADASCTTVQTCVECLDRTSGQVLFATMMFQPDESVCPIAKEEETTVLGLDESKPGTAAKPAPGQQVGRKKGGIVNYKVLQSSCSKGGYNLDVYIPGNEAKCSSDAYKVKWEVDGKLAGSSPTLQCVAGKSVKVTVTDVASGVKTVKVIKLTTGPTSVKKAKPKE